MAMQPKAKSVWAWVLYDFANSPFTTLVVTFVYAAYFTKAIATDEIQGTALWSRGLALTAIVVAIMSPILGALADRGGCRRRLLLGTTFCCIAATSALYFVVPGQFILALALFVVANISFELAAVFYNAMLPGITPEDSIGRVSGYGWALGYAGGLLALVVALLTLVQPDIPWFGFSKAAGEHIRATNLLAAAWFAVFSIPIFVWIRDPAPCANGDRNIVTASAQQLVATLREAKRYRQVLRFLLARLFYIDGLVTLFAFGGIYAAGTFGFSYTEILVFGIVLNAAAGVGAFALGFIDDRIGGKRTIQLSLIGLLSGSLLATWAADKAMFWAAGIVVGIFSGPAQSASRSLLGRFAPPDQRNEFYGLFAFSGKATAFLGPLLLGIVAEQFGSQRAGVAVIPVFFAIGFAVLMAVDEKAGIAAARQ